MRRSLERPQMHVEGTDDLHSIVHLLIRHGIDYDSEPWPAELPEFKKSGSVGELLEEMETVVELSTGRVIGFVLDADSPLLDRWNAVRDRLSRVGVDAPRQPPPGGFVGRSETYLADVGVWLMPDNQHDGKLETFLRTLIDAGDPLIDHATSATDRAKQLGAEFPKVDQIKALMHTWLAWQKEPGRPFGTAIRARFFRHDSTAAQAFVAWFKRLYRIS